MKRAIRAHRDHHALRHARAGGGLRPRRPRGGPQPGPPRAGRDPRDALRAARPRASSRPSSDARASCRRAGRPRAARLCWPKAPRGTPTPGEPLADGADIDLVVRPEALSLVGVRADRSRLPARSPSGASQGASRTSRSFSPRAESRGSPGAGREAAAAGREGLRHDARRTRRCRGLPAGGASVSRGEGPAGAVLTLLLVWLVCYPLAITVSEALGAPHWTLRHFVGVRAAAGRVARPLGEPLDLARDRGARRGDRRSARLPLRARRVSGPPDCSAPWSRCRSSCRRWSASSPSSSSTARAASCRAPCRRSLRARVAALAALGPGRDPARARLLDVRLLLPLHARRPRAARRGVPRGGGGARRRARADVPPRDAAAAVARAVRRGAC